MAKNKVENKVVKPKKAQIVKLDIDYNNIIDEMSHEEFNYCVDKLFPLLGYKVLEKSDVRKVDIKEFLAYFESIIPAGYRKYGTKHCYMGCLKNYVENVLAPEEGTRLYKYYVKALDVIDKAVEDEGSVYDAFLYFMMLMRNYDLKSKKVSGEPVFKAAMSDFDIIDNLCRNKDWEFEKLLEKKGKLGIKLPEHKFNGYYFMYINNILFLSKALYEFGVLPEEN